MSETEKLRQIVYESYNAWGNPVRNYETVCDIAPSDRERIVDELDRLSRLEQAAKEFCDRRQCHNCDRENPFCHPGDCTIIDALAEARGQK